MAELIYENALRTQISFDQMIFIALRNVSALIIRAQHKMQVKLVQTAGVEVVFLLLNSKHSKGIRAEGAKFRIAHG